MAMIRNWAWPILVLVLGFADVATADTFELNGGGSLSGEIVSANAQGLIVKKEDGSYSPRTGWTNFTQNALQQLSQNPKTKTFVEPFVEPPEDPAAAKKRIEITVKTPPRLERPDPKAGFSALFKSPLSIALLFILYLANVYAAYEVSIFRNYPPGAVCAVAAVAPILGPILFLCLPTRMQTTQAQGAETLAQEHLQHEHVVTYQVPQEGEEAGHPPPPPEAHGGPALPPPTVYARGHYSFNRRFFETKMAGFLRVVPGEAERDMLIHVKSSRGEHSGTRIARLTQSELYLHVTKAGASQDIMIPYNEIAEIQIRHKDLG